MQQEKEVTREEQQRYIDIALKVLREADLPVDEAPASEDDDDDEDSEPIEFREETEEKPPMVLAFLYNHNIAINISFLPRHIYFNIEMGEEYVHRNTNYDIDMTHRMDFFVAIVKQMMFVYELSEQFNMTDEIPRSLKIRDLLRN
jgi:hypothetical protein